MMPSPNAPDPLVDIANETRPPLSEVPRLLLRDMTWRVAVKQDSQREFCHQIAPGQDFYHRLGDGEFYLFRGTEKLCLPCAARRGLLTDEPKTLRESLISFTVTTRDGSDFELDLVEGSGSDTGL